MHYLFGFHMVYGSCVHLLRCQLVYYVLSPEDWTQFLALAQHEPCSELYPALSPWSLISHLDYSAKFQQLNPSSSSSLIFYTAVIILSLIGCSSSLRSLQQLPISLRRCQRLQWLEGRGVTALFPMVLYLTFPLHCSWTGVGARQSWHLLVALPKKLHSPAILFINFWSSLSLFRLCIFSLSSFKPLITVMGCIFYKAKRIFWMIFWMFST